jgi:integrase/recombinase XerD
MTVFLTAQGESFSRDHMSYTVKKRVDAAKLGKTGSCHLFRHTMATLMHEGGADIRYIQQMLGHEDIKSTQIYTHVALRGLQEVHAATHPAEAGHYRASRSIKSGSASKRIAPLEGAAPAESHFTPPVEVHPDVSELPQPNHRKPLD